MQPRAPATRRAGSRAFRAGALSMKTRRSALRAAAGSRKRLDSSWLVAGLVFGGLLVCEAEQACQCFGVRANGLSVVERLELFGGGQEQLLDDEMRDFIDARPRFGRQRRHLEFEALELRAPDRLEPLPQGDHRGDCGTRAEPGAELVER